MSRVEQTKEKCSMGEVACIDNVVDGDLEINFANKVKPSLWPESRRGRKQGGPVRRQNGKPGGIPKAEYLITCGGAYIIISP